MGVFRFRLQPVLDQRLRQERDRQLVVAAHERERLSLEAEVLACRGVVVQERADLRERLAGGSVDLRGARVQAHASLGAMLRTQRAALQLAGVNARLEMARRELLRATAARKAAELLRERQFEAWRYEQERRERIELDEITGAKAARKGAGEG